MKQFVSGSSREKKGLSIGSGGGGGDSRQRGLQRLDRGLAVFSKKTVGEAGESVTAPGSREMVRKTEVEAEADMEKRKRNR